MTVISSAPLRLGLFGGGTDVGEYAQKHGGLCLNLTINIRQEFSLGLSKRPVEDPFVKAFVDKLQLGGYFPRQRFERKFIGSGLGSSAAAAVALVGAANKINQWGLTRDEIAEKAWQIEVNGLGLFGGKQDQYAAAYGGLNMMSFGNRVEVVSLEKRVEEVYPWLLLFHSGVKRVRSGIQKGLAKITVEQKKYLDQIKELVSAGVVAIAEGDAARFGELLGESWRAKKRSNSFVSNEEIETLFEKARELGAKGGKLCGAGGGGCVLFVVPPPKQAEFVANIGLDRVDFEVDYQGVSTRFL